MTTTIEHDIDYAMRQVLQAALVADGLCIDLQGQAAVQWPNRKLDTAPLQQYVRYAFDCAPPVVREIGPRPAMTRRGHMIADIFVLQGSDEDISERLARVIVAAFPYATSLTRNGTEVVIDVVERKRGVESGSWWMTAVIVHFDVWR